MTGTNGVNGASGTPATSSTAGTPAVTSGSTGGAASTMTSTHGTGGSAATAGQAPKPSATGGTSSTSTGAAGTSTTPAGTGGAVATGASGAGGSAPSGGPCDTSTFMTDCQATGANWGMPSMFGPCSSGKSLYGVHMDFGPYGVRAKYNVGSGAGGVSFNDAFPGGCSLFISGFGADPVGSADLSNTHDLDFDKFSVFYPGCMPDGETFPLITWGDGTCAMPEGYGSLLRYVASFGYIIVAPNDLGTGDGTSMRKGLDFMLAENMSSSSEFYQHIDPDKIGAMGHSQGAGATLSAATDARIKAIITWNSGASSDKPFLTV